MEIVKEIKFTEKEKEVLITLNHIQSLFENKQVFDCSNNSVNTCFDCPFYDGTCQFSSSCRISNISDAINNIFEVIGGFND